MNIAGKKIENDKAYTLHLLESVGLDEEEANRHILKLSGGQQQRALIARCLSYDPKVILADEIYELKAVKKTNPKKNIIMKKG